jgi:hypothetical protein
VVRDPWSGGLPLGGFVRLRDAETRALSRVYVGRRQRASFLAAVAQRERTVCDALAGLGHRAGVLDRDPERSLLEVFGVA